MPELVCAADDPRWHDERRRGVTAGDITAITGLSPYESEYSLYWKKLGHISDGHEDTPRLRLGRDLEPLIIGRWKETGEWMAYDDRYAFASGTGLYRSDARPWQLATPDRVIYGPGATYASAVLEVKSWADADRHAWGAGRLYAEDGSLMAADDEMPPRVRAQVLWQMDTLDVAVGHVGVLFLPSGEFRSYVISHPCKTAEDSVGCEFCHDIRLMRAAGEEFMARLRLELPPPSPDASSATLAALKARFASPAKGKEAAIDGGEWDSFVFWTMKRAEADVMRQESENRIREQSGDATVLTVDGQPVARRTVSVVKAHLRKEGRRDSITRIKNGETDGSA